VPGKRMLFQGQPGSPGDDDGRDLQRAMDQMTRMDSSPVPGQRNNIGMPHHDPLVNKFQMDQRTGKFRLQNHKRDLDIVTAIRKNMLS